MNISDRYRALVDEARELGKQVRADKAQRLVARAVEELAIHEEGVGEIPQLRLEGELTPVLLKAHTQLDRSRLLVEEAGEEDIAAAVWEVEQRIYRLLNAL
jgi:hypothetical protein